MKPPFRLVPDQVSQKTVLALEQLLEEAREGKLIGVAFCGMYRNREYIVNTAGEAARNPTFTRGMIAALNDRLGSIVGSS